jgi:hypothetical protein
MMMMMMRRRRINAYKIYKHTHHVYKDTLPNLRTGRAAIFKRRAHGPHMGKKREQIGNGLGLRQERRAKCKWFTDQAKPREGPRNPTHELAPYLK